jgi:hypothetical protein
MHKLCLSLLIGGVLLSSLSAASAYEAMLGGAFALHAHPRSSGHIMTLGAGEIVNIDHCDHSWCAVTHGPHAGYIYMPRVLDGHVYNPYRPGGGYSDGGIVEGATSLLGAPVNAAGEAVDAGVSILR